VISRENRKIFPPPVLCAPADGVPLGIGYRRRAGSEKTGMMGLPVGSKVKTGFAV